MEDIGLEQPGLLVELATQSNSVIRERGLGKRSEKEPDGVSGRAPEMLCGDGGKFQRKVA